MTSTSQPMKHLLKNAFNKKNTFNGNHGPNYFRWEAAPPQKTKQNKKHQRSTFPSMAGRTLRLGFWDDE